MIHHGSTKLTLFNILSNVDRELNNKLGEELLNELNLEKAKISLQNDNTPVPIIPQEGDFYLFPFRHLSAGIVGAGTYKATDFSTGSVLSKSTKLLENKPAYLNHFLVANEEIGHVGETRYRRPYKNVNGEDVPGGIEGPFVIDAVLHPKLVRKMLSPVSPITSASVTVFFEWEASHDFEDPRDFFWHIGETIDDEVVRRMVTEVKEYGESSIVWMGADPYAKMLDDNGQVINIDKSQAFSRELPDWNPDLLAKKYFVFDCLDKSKLLHLSKSALQFSSHEPVENMNKEFLEYLAGQLGTTAEALQKGTFTKADAEKFTIKSNEDFKAIQDKATSLETVNADKVKLEGEKKTLEDQVKTLKSEKDTATEKLGKILVDDLKDVEPENLVKFAQVGQAIMKEESLKDVAADRVLVFVKAGKAIFKSTLEQAKKIYNQFAKGKPDETITEELENEVSLEKLNSKIKMWGGELVEKYGATCTKCGTGDNITFRQSDPEKDDPTPKNEPLPSMAEGLRQ